MQNKFVLPAIVAWAAMASTPASASFCVNSLALAGTSSTSAYETLITSANGCSTGTQQGYVADTLNGRYIELLVVNATSNPDVLSYQSTRLLNWGEYFRSDGSQAIDAASSLLGEQYKLYSILRTTGTVSVASGQFTATTGTLELWADQFSAPGGISTAREGWDFGLNPILSGASDDELLLTGLLDSSASPTATPSTFSLTLDGIAVSSLGSSYFIAPGSLSSQLRVSGDMTTGISTPGVFERSGTVIASSATFNVPEPGSLVLVSFALLGLGATAHRKKQA